MLSACVCVYARNDMKLNIIQPIMSVCVCGYMRSRCSSTACTAHQLVYQGSKKEHKKAHTHGIQKCGVMEKRQTRQQQRHQQQNQGNVNGLMQAAAAAFVAICHRWTICPMNQNRSASFVWLHQGCGYDHIAERERARSQTHTRNMHRLQMHCRQCDMSNTQNIQRCDSFYNK